MKHQTQTFQAILSAVENHNAQRLMDRARLANKLAKSVRGSARSFAYNVKHRALVSLKENFTERVRLNSDPFIPEFVVVKVKDAGFGLHAPAGLFKMQAAEFSVK